jgi:hypothetical protein
MAREKFDFEAFSGQAAEDLKSGKTMMSKGGNFYTIIEAAERSIAGRRVEHPFGNNTQEQNNRRNGKERKNMQSPLRG